MNRALLLVMSSTSQRPAEIRRGPIARFCGRCVLRVLGWKAVGQPPEEFHAVFVASPHTSNWDGVLMVVASFAMGVRLNWMGKSNLFRFPFRWILRRLGAVPVDRSKSNDLVGQTTEQFRTRKGMYLAIAPAGTRAKKDHWKSGFYHIAVDAQVPWLCGCVDYATKEVGIIGMHRPTGDMQADMDAIREIYRGRMGKHPELMNEIRLLAEDEQVESRRAS